MTEPKRDIHGAAVPPPPPAPCIEFDARAEAGDGGATNSPSHAAKRKGRRRRPSTSTIVALVAVVVVIAGIFFGMQALNAAQSRPVDTRLADTPAQNASGASGESADGKTTDEAAQKQAKADVQNSLDALADDEDGEFLAYVGEFVDSYDAGVTEGSYSFADLDISAADLAPRLRSEFECKVVKVDVYNGVAWVDVDVTSKSISSAAESFAKAVAGEALECDDERAYRERLKEALLDTLDKQKVRTVRVLLTLEHGDDGWDLAQSDVESLLGTAWHS